ncbi:MAG: ABC transporter ATP-binding protein [Steroidobacteraceae bacterium]
MILQADRLTLRRGTRTVLKNVDVSFATGAVTAVLGPNGAGKSTLLMCLAGLLEPESGRVLLNEKTLGDISHAERAQQIAFLPQLPEVAWPIDVEHLVGLGRIPYQRTASAEDNERAVRRAMEMTSTSQWAQRVVTELSGGERARVLLARVFANESRWILADEPFAGLDPSHQFEAAELLREFAGRGGGVLLTIHDLSLAARIADRIVLLHEGRVVADAAPEVALSVDNLRQVYGVETEWLIASARHRTPIIAIHGRHVG